MPHNGRLYVQCLIQNYKHSNINKDEKRENLNKTERQVLNIPVVSCMCLFNVMAKRNYYGETQEKQVQIEGETLERAKFYFNMYSLFWHVQYYSNCCR